MDSFLDSALGTIIITKIKDFFGHSYALFKKRNDKKILF